MNVTDDTIWDAVFKKPEEIVSRKVAGETLLVPIAGKLADMQRIFALNGVAEHIWEKLDGTKTLGVIRAEMLDLFDAGTGQLDSDIREFITELLKENLLFMVQK